MSRPFLVHTAVTMVFGFFCGVGVAAASVYFNVTRRTDAGRSCTDVRSDERLGGGEWGFFILRQGFKRRRNGHDDSNSRQGI